jgi:hypothetical protein
MRDTGIIDSSTTLVPDDAVNEAPPAIGTDERRMHVRAYNHWVSLLGQNAYPSIEDLDPTNLGDFGPHGVLLDFTASASNPSISFLGASLREECGLGAEIDTIADVPSRSLLSRLTDHYLQIIANRAPIGFEAEFVNQRGRNTLYRGILMPFSSDDEQIDFLYGVINWKELADVDISDELMLEVAQALRDTPSPIATGPVWADGPSAAQESCDETSLDIPIVAELSDDDALADRLAIARQTADLVRTADGRSRAALYRALGLAHDFATLAEARPDDYAELLQDNGLVAQERAPMTPIVKLVFGAAYDKTRLTEFAAALSYGRRMGVPAGALGQLLEEHDGGLKGIVKAERIARSPAKRDRTEAAREAMRRAPVRASLSLASGDAEFVLLVARREADGSLAVIAPVPVDQPLIDRAIRKVAR